MKIWFHRYELHPRWPPNARTARAPRTGALLRIGQGYADLHPWPELGDAPLETHLDSLRAEEPSPLATRSIRCAAIDGESREAGYSLFGDLKIPPSHFPLGPIDRVIDLPILEAAGYDRLKIKLGNDAVHDSELLMERSAAILSLGFRLRLDFNSAYGLAEIDQFLSAISSTLRSRIEFLEDPAPADSGLWRRIRSRWKIPIAADREKPAPDSWDIAVIKPASEDDSVIEDAIAAKKPVVITSAMDHPLGQMWAAWNAATLWRDRPKSLLPCGLLSHDSYETNSFSEIIRVDGSRLLPVGGTGLGFDEQLESLDWRPLR
ncbi:MAG: enolase C-terminal domain-like protein [Thermoanaerobaculia bacterium]